jgi:hypothetical protein
MGYANQYGFPEDRFEFEDRYSRPPKVDSKEQGGRAIELQTFAVKVRDSATSDSVSVVAVHRWTLPSRRRIIVTPLTR